MRVFTFFLLLLAFLFVFSCSTEKNEEEDMTSGQVIWNIDNVTGIGGNETTVLGSPNVIDTPGGKAVEFDGEEDGLIVNVHPLQGAETFTIEVIFCPYAEGLEEQRFFHLQENGTNNRFLIETRLTDDNRWYLDTFLSSGEVNQTLIDEKFLHPVGEWYNAALVFDGSEARHYVNGALEVSAKIPTFTPQKEGRTSIGVRINEVYWFKGAIRKARFTRRALSPEEFLKPYE